MKRITAFLMILILAVSGSVGASAENRSAGGTLGEIVGSFSDMKPVDYDPSNETLPYYRQLETEYKEKGYSFYTGEPVYTDISRGIDEDGKYAAVKQEDSVHFAELENGGSYTWTFEAKSSGLYNLCVKYRARDNNGSSILRKILIDGKTLCQELLSVSFDRVYREGEGPVLLSENGDELRRPQEKVFDWNTYACADSSGFLPRPFYFYFDEGTHSVTLEYIRDELEIAAISLEAPVETPLYSELSAKYSEAGCKPAPKGEDISLEAEDARFKNDPSVRAQSNEDPGVSPYANGSLRYNAFGGDAWSVGGQWVEWNFTVTKPGLYQIMLKTAQWFNDGRPSYRRILLDDAVPCRELEEYAFAYSTKWRNEIIADGDGNPFLFYLDEGQHTLKMAVQVGEIYPVVQTMEELSLELSSALRQIMMVTGSNIDPNYRYELDKKVPGLIDSLKNIRKKITETLSFMEETLDFLPYVYHSLRSMGRFFDDIIKTPDFITIRYGELENYQSNIGVWMNSMQKNALLLDRIHISAPQTEYPAAESKILMKISAFFRSFILSFFTDYRTAGWPAGERRPKDNIDVWISMGREYVEIFNQMTISEYTQKTNTGVTVSMFPQGQLNSGSANMLLLAINSGSEPDAVIGMDSLSPVEFAIRGASLDLLPLAEFEEVSGRFVSGSLTPYEYNGGVFAIPCTQDFMVTFYRKDIFSALNLGLPETWDDVYRIISALGSYGYQFYYPQFFDPFLYQYNGEYYSEDGTESALDTPEAYEAFKMFTELYTNYKIPYSANFYNRFRTGEIPIGIGGYTDYIQLSTAAPELRGRWGITRFPGHRDKDGKIRHVVSGSTYTANMILSTTKAPESAWDFLKWWMSDDAQISFGRQIETVMGIGGRWNSANTAAFRTLPMTGEEMETITAQWSYNKQQPVLLGSFATKRYLEFAVNDVIIGGVNPRDALEDAVKEINREIKAKRKEYGLD